MFEEALFSAGAICDEKRSGLSLLAGVFGFAFFDEGGDGFGEVFGVQEGRVPLRDVFEAFLYRVFFGVLEDFFYALHDDRGVGCDLGGHGAGAREHGVFVGVDFVDEAAGECAGGR